MDVFPNPAGNYISIRISNISFKNLRYEMRDAKSNFISVGKITSNTNKINTSNISSGIYFLEVFESEEPIKTLKIVKP
ncbi:MAG: T9SS type A sorting domain-containing protein [Cytophagales bacterium]